MIRTKEVRKPKNAGRGRILGFVIQISPIGSPSASGTNLKPIGSAREIREQLF